jgi:ATP-dependent DNA ligase I
MLLDEVVAASARVAGTRARLEKIGILAACLGRLAPGEIEAGVGLLTGEPRQGRLGVGGATLRDTRPPPAVAPALAVLEVDAALERIARANGPGSAGERGRTLGALLARATAAEQDFLRRLLVGELRQGAQEGVVVEAVARAAAVPAAAVRRALMLSTDLGAVAGVALAEGAAGLARFALTPLRPVQPMLAQTAAGAPEALARVGPAGRAAVEWKVDGARVQLHRVGGDVRVFTRHLNDVTAAVPELVEAALALPVRRVVLDGEAIALDPAGRPRAFQTTMRRFGRRLDVERLRRELPIASFFFDCLHLDGEDLIDRPAEERWAALAGALPAGVLVPRRVAADPTAVEAFAREALGHGHEGVMVKSLAAPYEAGRRGAGWQKLKPAHDLDLVALAAEWGSGRRRGWLSNLHLGARDPARGGFVMLGKTFKGMTDEMLRWQTAELLAREIGREDHVVHVRPELVVEVLCDGVQASPHYPGGVALRFARVRRWRPDKRAEDADTIERVQALRGPE